MSPAPHIRRATADDVPDLLRLYERSGLDAPGSSDAVAARATFERMQSCPHYHVWVAEVDGQAVGTLALAVLDNLAHRCAPSALVEDVAVDPQAQGQGVGRALMHHAMQQARQAGCYKLALSTRASRTQAHAFYHRLGFEVHGLSFMVPLNEQ